MVQFPCRLRLALKGLGEVALKPGATYRSMAVNLAEASGKTTSDNLIRPWIRPLICACSASGLVT